jgi:hypothetical protein
VTIGERLGERGRLGVPLLGFTRAAALERHDGEADRQVGRVGPTLGAIGQPPQRCPDVVDDRVDSLTPLVALRRPGGQFIEDPPAPTEVAFACCVELATRSGDVGRVLAERLQHAVAAGQPGAQADQVPVDEPSERAEQFGWWRHRHLAGRVERERCREHGARPEQRPLVLVEQLVAPVDRGA